MNGNSRDLKSDVGTAHAAEATVRKHWAAPVVIVSAISRNTGAKTSSGFGFETHSPGSLNGS